MLKLYYYPQTRAGIVRWLLEEIGTPYELVRVDLAAGEQRAPAYRKINPNGTVPTLIDGDLILYESAAIVQYLADKFPQAHLAPALGTAARGKYYQWIHYAMSSIEPPSVTIFLHTNGARIGSPPPERLPQLLPEARAQLAAAMKIVDDELATKEFILGDQFSAADVMIASKLGWCLQLGMAGADAQHVQAYLTRLVSRPRRVRAQAE